MFIILSYIFEFQFQKLSISRKISSVDDKNVDYLFPIQLLSLKECQINMEAKIPKIL